MSGTKQFWLGATTLALALGLLVGSVLMPDKARAQDAEGRTSRFALVRGVRGTTQGSETVYITDDLNEMLFIFEYTSRSKNVEIREFVDLQMAGAAALKKRASREKK